MSCQEDERGRAMPSSIDYDQQQAKRRRRDTLVDDEDYDYEGSGGSKNDEDEPGLDDIMDRVGDADIIICNNLERALYLSLKYEFVTPLTSLVVVKPDSSNERGNFGEMNDAPAAPADISFSYAGSASMPTTTIHSVAAICALVLLWA